MGRPVNADNADMDGYGSESKVQREQSPYEKGVRDGHDAGYKQGKQDRQQGSPDASPTPPDKLRVPEPESNPYNKDHDKQNNQRYKMAGILRTALLIILAGILLKGQVI